MGRDKKYYRTMQQQAYDRLTAMQAFGESKRDAIKNGTAEGKIFSFTTYKTYWQQTKQYVRWVEKEHPECRTLKKARAFVPEYLQRSVDEGKSAWTVQTQTAALNKLYGIKLTDEDRFEPPVRHRVDIVRSRGEAARDRHFSERNNDELIRFCRGTGARRAGLTRLRGRDLVTRDQIDQHVRRLESLGRDLTDRERTQLTVCRDAQRFDGCAYFVYLKEKGGRERISPIVGPDTEKIVERFRETKPDEKVWKYVSSNADVHGYRADYAKRVYLMYARDTDELRKEHATFEYKGRTVSAVYVCRGDEKGRMLDKAAMSLASKALGHSRIEVVANNYIRGL